jgi:hypothetical protein
MLIRADRQTDGETRRKYFVIYLKALKYTSQYKTTIYFSMLYETDESQTLEFCYLLVK